MGWGQPSRVSRSRRRAQICLAIKTALVTQAVAHRHRSARSKMWVPVVPVATGLNGSHRFFLERLEDKRISS
jgi:hypothetical protein